MQIQEKNIGFEVGNHLDGFGKIGSFTDDFDSRLFF
jgi:hypothetical protein